MEHFISKIQIEKLRHLENIEIFLSEDERRHLLLTGKKRLWENFDTGKSIRLLESYRNG